MELRTEKRLVVVGVVAEAVLAGLTGLSGFDIRLIVPFVILTFLVLWRLLAVSHKIRNSSNLPTFDSDKKSEESP